MFMRKRRSAAARKRRSSYFSAPKGFDHLMAGDGFLKDLIEFAGGILRATAGAADAATQPRGGNQNEGKQCQCEECQLPVRSEDDDEQADHLKGLAKQIGKHIGAGGLNFVDVAHD